MYRQWPYTTTVSLQAANWWGLPYLRQALPKGDPLTVLAVADATPVMFRDELGVIEINKC